MKKRVYLLLATLLMLSAISGCHESQQTNRTDVTSEKKESIQITLVGYKVPLTVDQVVRKLGASDSTYIDNNESCPIGQLHFWDFKEKNYTFLVLGDSYDKEIDYSAGSRLIGIKKSNQDEPSQFDGFLEILLDDSEAEVKRKLESFVVRNLGFSISQNNGRSPIHRFFCSYKKFKLQYILEKGGLYVYFIINKDDKLEAVIMASFNVLAAC